MSLESERRGAGAATEASRKAIAASVSADRSGSGSQVSNDLSRLVTTKRKSTALPVLDARGAVPATKGVGTYNPKNAPAAAGGGIASPLTESDFTKREYWGNGLLSSDGLFTIPSIKKLVLTDANGGEAVLNLAQPIPATTTA